MADEEKSMREVFDRYDVEKEGYIQTFEIVNALYSLKFNKTQAEVDDILSELNIAGATLSFDQFRSVVEMADETDQRAELVEAFKMFDKENKGYITYAQLKKILKPMMGKGITEEELNEIVEQADADKSGTIEIEEFVDFLSQ